MGEYFFGRDLPGAPVRMRVTRDGKRVMELEQIAQRILVFEDGKIIAGGSSAELLANSERYRALYELQANQGRSGES